MRSSFAKLPLEEIVTDLPSDPLEHAVVLGDAKLLHLRNGTDAE